MAPDADTDFRSDHVLEQWKGSVETIRFMMGLLVQLCGFLVTADSALIAYGLTRDMPSVIAVGAVLPFMMAVITYVISQAAAPIVFTAIRLERELTHPGLMTQLVRFRAPAFLAAVEEIMHNEGGEETGRQDARLPRFALRSRMLLVFLLAATGAQLLLAAYWSP